MEHNLLIFGLDNTTSLLILMGVLIAFIVLLAVLGIVFIVALRKRRPIVKVLMAPQNENEQKAEQPAKPAFEEPAPVEEAVAEPEEAPVEEEPVVEEPEEAAPVEEEPVVEEPEEVVPVEEEPAVEEPEEETPVEEEIIAEEPAEEPVVVAPVTEESVEEEDEEEEGAAFYTEDGQRVRYNRSFTAKLIQLNNEAKDWYTELKNELLSYDKVKARMSWKRESFRKGRMTIARLVIRGKTLCLLLAVGPVGYSDTKYKVEDVSNVSSLADTPTLYRIKNERRLRYAKELIADMMQELDVNKKANFEGTDYSQPYQDDMSLIQCGLIKLVVSGSNREFSMAELMASYTSEKIEPAPVIEEAPAEETVEEVVEEVHVEEVPVEEILVEEVVEELEEVAPVEEPETEEVAPVEEEPVVEEPVEEVPVEEEPVAEESEEEDTVFGDDDEEDGTTYITEGYERIRYNRSFTAKLCQLNNESKEWYSALKNKLLGYKKMKARTSWKRESFRLGRITLARIVVRGKTLCLFLATDPAAYTDTKYKVEDVSNVSSLADTPTLYRIKSARRFKYALELIESFMHEHNLQKDLRYEEQDYYLPYEGDISLMRRGLVKRVVSGRTREFTITELITPKAPAVEEPVAAEEASEATPVEGIVEEVVEEVSVVETVEEPVEETVEETVEATPVEEAVEEVVEEVPVEEVVEEPVEETAEVAVEESPAEETVEETTVEEVTEAVEPEAEEETEKFEPEIEEEFVYVHGENKEDDSSYDTEEYATYNSAFMEKYSQLSDEHKEWYSNIKNELLSYDNIKVSSKWKSESHHANHSTLVRLVIRNNTIYLLLAANPDKYSDTKYEVENLSASPNVADTPTLYSIKTELNLEYAKELIEGFMHELSIDKGNNESENSVKADADSAEQTEVAAASDQDGVGDGEN